MRQTKLLFKTIHPLRVRNDMHKASPSSNSQYMLYSASKKVVINNSIAENQQTENNTPIQYFFVIFVLCLYEKDAVHKVFVAGGLCPGGDAGIGGL